MTLKELRATMTQDEWKALGEKVGSSYKYLNKITYQAPPGPLFAKKLVAAEPRLTLHELRPDIWD